MAVGDREFKVQLKFEDLATGKMKKATAEQINSMKKVGVQVKKTGTAAQVSLNKMGVAHEKAAHKARFQNREIGKLAGSIGSLRNMILVWMFALRPLIALFKSATEAMTIQEDAIKRLNFAMEIQGTHSEFMEKHLHKLSAAFQETTRYGDEMILQVMEKLITVGGVMPSSLKRATQATLDFAAGTGRGLSEAGELIAKGAVGYTMQIARLFGITIPKTMSVAKQFEIVLGLIEGKMGGRAQRDIASYGGSVAQMSNAWGDAKESLGFFLNKLLKLQGAFVFLKGVFDTWSGKNVSTEMKKINLELEKIEEFRGTKQPMISQGQVVGYIDFTKEEQDAKKRILILKRTQLQIQEFMDLKREEEQGKVIKAEQDKLAIQKQWDDKYIIFRRTQAKYRMEDLETEYAAYRAAYTDNVTKLLEIEEEYQVEKTKLIKLGLQEAKDQYDASEVFMKAYATNMRDAMSDGFFKVMKGDFETLGDVVIAFGDTMLKTITDIIANLIIMTIWQKAAGFLGFPGGVAGKVVGAVTATAHTGGYIMNTDNSYGYRKKFHNGGEVPATLLEGEGVVNRSGMNSLGVDNLNKLNRGEGMGGGTTVNNYYIQTIDERSFRERLQENPDIYADASGADIKNNGPLRQTSQKWG